MLDPVDLALTVPALLIAVTFHEFAHARVALAFGDTTAEEAGRVTLNPLAHLDPIGTLGMLFAGFGWGKPVPVNSSVFRHPRADFFVSAAGPFTNFGVAVIGALAFRLLRFVHPDLESMGQVGTWLFGSLWFMVDINLRLGLFNLIPLFPLDGSHMAGNVLPLETAYSFKKFNEAYGPTILFGLLFLGMMTKFSVFGFVLGPVVSFLQRVLLT